MRTWSSNRLTVGKPQIRNSLVASDGSAPIVCSPRRAVQKHQFMGEDPLIL